ncbi:hypothetical protein ACSBR1_014613 [Camellia fascicularis]
MTPYNFCKAKRFEYEPPNFCYYNGEIVLASPEISEYLRTMVTSQTIETVELRRHIRAYNSIFAFTLFGVKLDKELANSRRGVYWYVFNIFLCT